jgi:very-short-patch-repair endonuclease
MTQNFGSRDGVVAKLAGAQRTIVSHEELIAHGYGRRVIAHWVNRGRLTSVFHGVYSVVQGDLPPLAREQAALIACGEGAFLSHRSAAFVWGLRKTAPVTVEVTVRAPRRASHKGIHVHRIRAIADREVRFNDGLWVSSPERAVLEIAAVAPAELPRVIEDGLAARKINRRELEAVLARNRPCRGAARLAEILGDSIAMTMTRSQRERAFLKLIRESGLPLPETNAKLGPFEPDFLWRRERLVVEIDGYNFHSGPDSFSRDREKDLFFKGLNLDVVRFTGDHVLNQPAMVLAMVAQELARRSRA